jgi:hypothetical protein
MKTLLLPSQIGNATHARVTVQDGTEPSKTAGFVYVLGTLQEQPTQYTATRPEVIGDTDPIDRTFTTKEERDEFVSQQSSIALGWAALDIVPECIFIPTEGESWTYCAIAGVMHDEEIAAYIVANPAEPAPVVAAPPTVSEYTAGIQAWLDSEAAKLGYDNALSLCTYADSTVPKFYEEAREGIKRRDFAWSRGYEMLATPPEVLPSVAELVDQIAKEFESQ